VPAKRRIARALPEVSARPVPKPVVAKAAPKRAAKPAVKVAKAAPKPAVPRVVSEAPAPEIQTVSEAPQSLTSPDSETVVETTAQAPAPIVLKMRGEQVLEASPRPAPKPAVKRAMVARAEETRPAAKPVAPVAPEATAPQTGNPAPQPAHITASPRPTAPAVRAARSARPTRPTTKVARATQPIIDLRPEIIRELPADRVQDGHIRHAIRPGETVADLAHRYGVPVRRLLAENHLGRRADLRIGHDVRIPAPFRVAFNDETVQFDVAPRIENGVTLAALRQVYEQAGGRLTWNPARREVRATDASANIILRVGSREALVNGRRLMLAAPK
jgi:hypothetical protein